MTAPVLDGFERVLDADLEPGDLRQARLADGTRVCVGNSRGTLFAVQDECTHSAFPLSDCSLLNDGSLQCECHGARFDPRTGEVLRGPAEDPLATFDVAVADGAIWVRRKS